jgi:hypothetical protein
MSSVALRRSSNVWLVALPTENMPSVETLVSEALHDYPTLFGRSRLCVLSQLLITNGNGYGWRDGTLHPIFDRT